MNPPRRPPPCSGPRSKPTTSNRSLLGRPRVDAVHPYTDPMILGPAGRSASSPAEPLLGRAAVLVPVKAFAVAKRRLGPALSDQDRRALVRRLAEGVLAAAAPLQVAVVCDDTEVADWARDQ